MRENTSFTFGGTSLTVNRLGYGAMQLAGQDGDKKVWGPPRDIPSAIAVLREAVASGVNHIDTSDFYGPHVTNQIIKQALHPYLSSANPERANRVARKLAAGRVLINTISHDPFAPFGGFKQSGIGREGGIFGLQEYLEPKAIIS